MPEARNWKQEIARALGEDVATRTEVIEEMAQHVESRYRTLLARGVAEQDAYRDALDELSDPGRLAEEIRGIGPPSGSRPPDADAYGRRAGWLDVLRHDVRYGLRTLRRNPGFTFLACLALALGVGANTAIFTIVNAVMLRPLPFAEPDRLVRIWESNPSGGWPIFSASHPNFLDWRAQSTSFEALAAMTGASFSASGPDGAEIVRANAVTSDFLPVLGVVPAMGRNFRPDEDRPGGNTRVMLLTHPYWQRRFAGAPDAVGQSLVLNGNGYTIVGVLPESYPWGDRTLDLLVPLAPDPARSRGDHRLLVIGRLKPGVTIDRAHTELSTIAARLEQQFPDSNQGWTVRLASFYDWLIPEDTRESLLIMSGAVALVLLIACGNVANLLLARGAARQRELSIRAALGAERSRIVRQLLVEAMLLALIATAAGLLIAYGSIELLTWSAPAVLPRLDELSIDTRVLAFALGTAVATGFLFGLLPALQASRPNLNDTLKYGAAGAGGSASRQRLRSALVVGEVALSVALLIGAGLLVRSLWRLQQVDPGFRQENVVTARINLPATRYRDDGAFWSFYQRFLERARTLPGVEAAAVGSIVPMGGGNTSSEIQIPGAPVRPGGASLGADWRVVSPDYFKALRIPLRGRDFDERDGPAAQPVAIISEEAARRYFPNVDPIGRTLIIRSFTDKPSTIIGVAGDVRGASLDSDPAPMVYGSTKMYAGWNPMHLAVRGAMAPEAYVSSIRELARSIDTEVPVYDVRSAEDLVAQSLGPRRFNMYLLGCFAVVALLLASVGLFGVMAYLVSQRTRDIGIRLALGASRGDVLRMIMGHGLLLTIVGVVLGVGAGVAIKDLMRGLLFSIAPTDATTFIAVPALLIFVALLACFIPARRAMGVDPLIALRAE
jgi:putative ABC transport system permease protein